MIMEHRSLDSEAETLKAVDGDGHFLQTFGSFGHSLPMLQPPYDGTIRFSSGQLVC